MKNIEFVPVTRYSRCKRYSGAKIARSRISSKVLFAETFAVGRGVIDINVTSDASREIINVGNEIIRNL